ncbi:flavodoxin family protein [Methanohalobium sp.]|uniref:flavodoxin family protein n=1 Tax=Methanohalobium sp. TaxID=2837493 RepID=UPI0025EFE20A|nr:flavodoxin family protein [Methanohalobium sp.]
MFYSGLGQRYLHVKPATIPPRVDAIINIRESNGWIPAIPDVKILASATCGLTNIVADVVIIPLPTTNPTASPINLEPTLRQPITTDARTHDPQNSAIQVTYMSQTGNTKKIADAIYDEIEDNKTMKDMDTIMERATQLNDVRNLENYDLIFIGFPIQQFGIPDKVREFFDKKLQPREQVLKMGKKQKSTRKDVALFITHGAPDDFEQLPKWLSRAEDEAAK